MKLDEIRWMVVLQEHAAAAVVPAKALSAVGEHAAGWLVMSGCGVAFDRSRRAEWAAAGLSVFLAHAAAVVLKRLVRRRRPSAPRLVVQVRTPSGPSFPSAHVASTTAMAVACVPLFGVALPASIAAAQMTGRVLLGVHYPTDVLAGAALGTATAIGVRGLLSRAGSA